MLCREHLLIGFRFVDPCWVRTNQRPPLLCRAARHWLGATRQCYRGAEPEAYQVPRQEDESPGELFSPLAQVLPDLCPLTFPSVWCLL
jgi:hypothetical protein